LKYQEQIRKSFAISTKILKQETRIYRVKQVWNYLSFGLSEENIKLDITLAVDYPITRSNFFGKTWAFKSVQSGRRYINLTWEHSGAPGYQALVFLLVSDRIYDVMDELNLFPDNQSVTTNCCSAILRS
jgi:histidyl-tRNA synthetase